MQVRRTSALNSPQVRLFGSNEVPDFIGFLAKRFIAVRIVEDVLNRLTDETGTASDEDDFTHDRQSSKLFVDYGSEKRMKRNEEERRSTDRVQVASIVSAHVAEIYIQYLQEISTINSK